MILRQPLPHLWWWIPEEQQPQDPMRSSCLLYYSEPSSCSWSSSWKHAHQRHYICLTYRLTHQTWSSYFETRLSATPFPDLHFFLLFEPWLTVSHLGWDWNTLHAFDLIWWCQYPISFVRLTTWSRSQQDHLHGLMICLWCLSHVFFCCVMLATVLRNPQISIQNECSCSFSFLMPRNQQSSRSLASGDFMLIFRWPICWAPELQNVQRLFGFVLQLSCFPFIVRTFDLSHGRCSSHRWFSLRLMTNLGCPSSCFIPSEPSSIMCSSPSLVNEN